MSEHSELLKDARELANYYRGGLLPEFQLAVMIGTLADLVEAYAKSQPELVAACKTCDADITQFLEPHPEKGAGLWNRLDAARHLARRAAKLAEPERDAVEQTMAEATTKYDDLLKWLADDDTTNQVDPLAAEEAELEADLAEAAKQPISVPAPPIEVEMRVTHPAKYEWGWECQLCHRWLTIPDCEGIFYVAEDIAKLCGQKWLAALSDQLGVPLVAVWEDGDLRTR